MTTVADEWMDPLPEQGLIVDSDAWNSFRHDGFDLAIDNVESIKIEDCASKKEVEQKFVELKAQVLNALHEWKQRFKEIEKDQKKTYANATITYGGKEE